ncbi:MAG TPA: DHHA1 domain-containing protein, partial [Anaerolineales bacterium]|nr:DHHA1 domain-containing protein [Anaerolineales bacterium]
IARGSARSVEGINITSAIAEHAEMLLTFGGHPMAAGVSLAAEKIPAFRRALSESVERMRGDAEVAPLQIDAFLPLTDLSLNLVEEIGRLAPFGAGNPALVLATRNLKVKESTFLGRTKEHIQVFVEDENEEVQKVFWWRGAEPPAGAGNPLPEGRFDLAYSVRASDFRGERQLQIEWVDFRPVERATIEIPVPRASRIVWVDHREVANPISVLQGVQARGGVIFAEGEAKIEVGGMDREALFPASELAIWTPPPGPREWKAILETVKPEKVYLFAGEEGDRSFEGFIKRLAGLLKFGMTAHEGRVELSVLAASTGQREETVKKGVEWLVEKGMFELVKQTKGAIFVRVGKNSGGAIRGQTEAALQKLFEETRAYRRFWAKASVDSLNV